MTTLPSPELFDNLPGDTRNAYVLVKKAEALAESSSKQDDLVCARVVGYLLLYPVNDTSRQTVTSEVLSINEKCNDEVSQKVFSLGKMYMGHLIRPCMTSFQSFCIGSSTYFLVRKNKGRTPISTPHISFDKLRDLIKTTLVKPRPENYSQAKANVRVLALPIGFESLTSVIGSNPRWLPLYGHPQA